MSHYWMLVFFKEPQQMMSGQARGYVYSHLIEQGFIAEGRWACGIADWFVIGGRWSGELSMMLQDQEKVKGWEDIVSAEGLSTRGGGKENENQRATRLIELWHSHFPDLSHMPCPYLRDTYLAEGYEDDAMKVTEELWERILSDAKKWQDSVIEGTDVIENQDHYVDLEFDDICKEKTLGKWVVVVDYHN